MPRRLITAIAAATAALTLVAATGCTSGGSDQTATTTPQAGPGKPNILVIMTDDQTLESMRIMDSVKAELADQGTTFSRYYVSFPNCCPSRATYYTGQYSHNTGVEDNVPPLGGAGKLRADETLPVWLQRAGYTTAHVGKYLNGWGEDGNIAPPPGWSRWFGLIDPTTYQYYGYHVSDNGVEKEFGDSPADYQTDVLGDRVVQFINAQSTTGKPWFVSFTPLAPHSENSESVAVGSPDTSTPGEFKWASPKPPPRYERSLVAKAPRPPSFNDPETKGKPAEIAEKPVLSDGVVKLIDQGYQKELETLQAVDEWVGKIVKALRDTKQLDNTVIFFTSDNGYFHGEHRLAFQKFELYEPAVHLPLIVRGGAFPKRKTISQLAGNVDLAPTILALAGAKPGITVDGADLLTIASDEKANPFTGRALLLENKSHKGVTESILTGRYKYIDRRGEKELYDLEKDPDERTNIVGDPGNGSLVKELQARLAKLQACAGDSCRTS